MALHLPNFIKNFFNKFAKFTKDLISAALPIARQIIMGQLTQFAEQTVQELNNTDLNNDERRNLALGKIKGYAVQNGIEARDSLVHALISLAVLKFKEDF